MPHRLLSNRQGGLVRAIFDLVAPLAQHATDKRINAVSPLIGLSFGEATCIARTNAARFK